MLGDNGAGKSSTMRAIVGLAKAGGSIAFNGRPIARLPAHRRAALGIGYVPEGRRVFTDLTVRENLLMGVYLAPAETAPRLQQVLAIFPQLAELDSGNWRRHCRAVNNRCWQSGGPDAQAGTDGAGRAVAGPVAGAGAGDLPHDLRGSAARHDDSAGGTERAPGAAAGRPGLCAETGRMVVEGEAAALLSNMRVREAYLGGT